MGGFGRKVGLTLTIRTKACLGYNAFSQRPCLLVSLGRWLPGVLSEGSGRLAPPSKLKKENRDGHPRRIRTQH